MPSIDQYITNDAYLRLSLQGPSGVGKTTLACQFPDVHVFDCDQNLAGPLRWLKANGKSLPLSYDIIDRDDKGAPVPENMRYARLIECINRLGKDKTQPEPKTLVFDSGTKIGDYIKAHVLRTNPTKTGGFEQQSWGFYYSEWVRLVSTVTAARVNAVFIFHERVEKDEVDGSLKYLINVQGQFQNVAISMFTDAWRAEVMGGGGLNPTYKWQIRTMPDFRYVLKNSLGLPPLFEFSWDTIQAKLTPPTP